MSCTAPPPSGAIVATSSAASARFRCASRRACRSWVDEACGTVPASMRSATMPTEPVRVERRGAVTTVVLSRPQVKNAVDKDTADALDAAFLALEQDDAASVAVLWGEGGTFSAGADLKAIAAGQPNRID